MRCEQLPPSPDIAEREAELDCDPLAIRLCRTELAHASRHLRIAAPTLAPAIDGILSTHRDHPALRSVVYRFREAAVPASYLILASGLFANAWLSPVASYVGSLPDALQSMWFLSWTAHALTASQSLLFTHALNAPLGINLLWNTAMLLPGIVLAPITLRWGALVAYNVFIILAVAGSAWAAYIAIRPLARSRPASWLGGLLFGCSPYMVAQALGHVDLVMMVYVPLSLWFFLELVVFQRHSWRVLGAGFGALTAAQFFVFPELLGGVGIAFVAGLALLAVQHRERIGKRCAYAARVLAAALVIALLLVGWAMWYQVSGPQTPPGLSEVANATGSDLLAFVTPTTNQLLSPSVAHTVAAQFAAQATGEDAYIGLPLLALLGMVVRVFRRDPVFRALAGVAGALIVLSLGSALNVAGHALPVPLPWIVFQHVPFIANLVPLRLMGYADLLIAALVACLLGRLASVTRPQRAVALTLIALVVASWIPSLPRPATPLPAAFPPALLATLPAEAVVLFVPYPSLADADAMYYQAQADFSFSLTYGYAYGVMPALPLQSALGYGGDVAIRRAMTYLLTPANRTSVVQRLRTLEVTNVVVPPGRDAPDRVALLTRLFGSNPVRSGGFAAWTLGTNSG